MISDTILNKPGRLTDEEFKIINNHTVFGVQVSEKILSGLADTDYVKLATDIAQYHHERCDGKGYPKGLKGREIPLSARIMAIADVFDCIEKEAGTHFDLELAKIFVQNRQLILMLH